MERPALPWRVEVQSTIGPTSPGQFHNICYALNAALRVPPCVRRMGGAQMNVGYEGALPIGGNRPRRRRCAIAADRSEPLTWQRMWITRLMRRTWIIGHLGGERAIVETSGRVIASAVDDASTRSRLSALRRSDRYAVRRSGEVFSSRHCVDRFGATRGADSPIEGLMPDRNSYA